MTAKSLVVSEGNKVIREEPMVDFHGPQAPRGSGCRHLRNADVDDAVAATAAC